MADIHLTLGINEYDHVRDLFTREVKPKGIEVTSLVMEVEETFKRFLAHQEWDISEISFAMSCQAISRGKAPFVLIPVFPSRLFRLSGFYIRSDGSVKNVEDLRGKKVGLPQWAQTATTYARGWLTETIGIPLNQIDWYQLGPNSPGRLDNTEEKPPKGVSLTNLPDGSLADMLVEGEIDALITADPPRRMLSGDPSITRLYSDFESVEHDYFSQTGIFPIMHTVALRRSTYEENPWIARNLFNAFEEAKNNSVRRMRDMNVSQIGLPWIQRHVERIETEFFPDGDYWPYGVERNRTTIDAFLRFCFDQGVTTRHLKAEEIFVKEALEPFHQLRV
ncbi:MAG: 4,5-dihydroxyphthalate decarboxylase [Rhodospirillaceae bacterium]|nr:4,5-dihydroxyphthalate decarboxylase [Rhodospirillaceae bacterium]|tara:strand:+ start:6842 stop:7846 length:1005 start_codon:yes stop_codon:yes gene_type:complete